MDNEPSSFYSSSRLPPPPYRRDEEEEEEGRGGFFSFSDNQLRRQKDFERQRREQGRDRERRRRAHEEDKRELMYEHRSQPRHSHSTATGLPSSSLPPSSSSFSRDDERKHVAPSFHGEDTGAGGRFEQRGASFPHSSSSCLSSSDVPPSRSQFRHPQPQSMPAGRAARVAGGEEEERRGGGGEHQGGGGGRTARRERINAQLDHRVRGRVE